MINIIIIILLFSLAEMFVIAYMLDKLAKKNAKIDSLLHINRILRNRLLRREVNDTTVNNIKVNDIKGS